jgi:hypothetical protein
MIARGSASSMIIWGAAGRFGRPTLRSPTDGLRIGETFPIVAEEGEPMRPTGEVRTIAELSPQRDSREYRSSVDGFALSARAKGRGSG